MLNCSGVYGDVIRVKILYNKRDSALIQFREPQHAQTGGCGILTELVVVVLVTTACKDLK